MKYFYTGNLNLAENKRIINGITIYLRGHVQYEGEYYERYAIQTPFIGPGENLEDYIREYVVPVFRQGDILAVTEKVVALSESRILDFENRRLSIPAAILGRCMKKTVLDWDPVMKMQAFIDLFGLPKVVLAAFWGAMGKIIGRDGNFYRILGDEAVGMDGGYTGSPFPLYRKHFILIPHNAPHITKQLEAAGCPTFVSDTNDAVSRAYALSEGCRSQGFTEEKLKALLADNPGGQNDELTPFILIRKTKPDELEACRLPKKISEEEFRSMKRQSSNKEKTKTNHEEADNVQLPLCGFPLPLGLIGIVLCLFAGIILLTSCF